MIELELHRELDAVAQRFRRRRMWAALTICWTIFALAGLAVLWWSQSSGRSARDAAGPLAGLAILAAVAGTFIALRSSCGGLHVARRIEGRFPELDSRLLTALAQTSGPAAGSLGFLQHTVIH